MFLEFPNAAALALVLRAGVLPAETVTAPVRGRLAANGRLIVTTDLGATAEIKAALKPWGVTLRSRGKEPAGELLEAGSWAELAPVERDRAAGEIHDRLPVIFWLTQSDDLAPLVHEILRQGNDRLSLRTLSHAGQEHILLRVIGPPYYSVLRTLEDSDARLKAFAERAPRVWIELGHAHPLAATLQPAAGQWLFLSPPRRWTAIDEAPFGDIYQAVDLKLAPRVTTFTEAEPPKIQVPLKLVRGGGYERGDLWVLKEKALEQIDRFVQSAADQTLARLAFAVLESQGEPVVVLRTRPGKSTMPELVFEGVAYRPVLKLPNLFVPIGRQLHPPLRRDVVKQMLADDISQTVWLEEAPAGGFTPCAIAETAFRPLNEWVEYVLDRHREPLETWLAATTFDFEPFVCEDDLPDRQRPAKQPREQTAGSESASPGTSAAAAGPLVKAEAQAPPSVKRREPTPVAQVKPSELEKKLQTLEKRFLALETPLDDPARAAIWYEMAMLQSLLGRFGEAPIAFAHALWETHPETSAWEVSEEWLALEIKASSSRTAEALRSENPRLASGALAKLLEAERPAQQAQLVAAQLENIAELGLADRFDPSLVPAVQRFLERAEALVSVRVVWLAWHALYRLTSDVLMLARARDRLLHRLHEHGLSADLEVPVFVRASGSAGDHYRVVRDEILKLHALVHDWSQRTLRLSSAHTHDYIDLMFAFALARLGENSRSQQFLEHAHQRLRNVDSVHRWLCDAFEYRIVQVLEGQAATGQFPERYLADAAILPPQERYKVDRLRQQSRILEPHERLEPYRFNKYREGSTERRIYTLPDFTNRGQLEAEARLLWKEELTPPQRAALLSVALELSWRVSESFAEEMLQLARPALGEANIPTHSQVELIEKGLFAAAHYDLRAPLEFLLSELRRRLAAAHQVDDATYKALESALAQTLRSLRQLGLRGEVGEILEDASLAIHASAPSGGETPEQLRMLLALAGAGFYFGHQHGWRDVDRVRDRLLAGDVESEGDIGVSKQTLVAVSYLQAVGQAPLNEALARFREYFEETSGMRETATVGSHYSLKQLNVVETLLQTMISDSFTMDRSTRAWIDDEEFLIRRRIHRDVRQAMENQ